jgi:hypothetical protein
MKTLLICIACYFVVGYALLAQPINLVPNPSFEYLSDCPKHVQEVRKAYPWFSGSRSLLITFSQIYNPCNDTVPAPYNQCCGVPTNGSGYQQAHTGLGYAGISFVHGLEDAFDIIPEKKISGFLEAGLLDSLLPKKKYCIQFFVSNMDKVSCGLENGFQAYFTKDSIFPLDTLRDPIYRSDSWSNYPVQFTSNNGLVYDTLNWVEISGSFIAKGGEKFMTIGNFEKDDTCQYVAFHSNIRTPIREMAYYYIDDVSVYLCDDDTIPVPPPPPLLVAVPHYISLQNPSSNPKFVIQNLPANSSLWLYNSFGQLIHQSNNYQNSYSFLQQNAAMYFYILRTPIQTLKGKIIVNN